MKMHGWKYATCISMISSQGESFFSTIQPVLDDSLWSSWLARYSTRIWDSWNALWKSRHTQMISVCLPFGFVGQPEQKRITRTYLCIPFFGIRYTLIRYCLVVQVLPIDHFLIYFFLFGTGKIPSKSLFPFHLCAIITQGVFTPYWGG